MAMREKQLGALGMLTNEKGQVTASSTLLSQMEELGEETGLVCVICREGYRCQPSKVLGVYTFTKRCALEEEERKQRRSLGYSTVSHFNVVHVDCHMAAVRQARTRDEWESAALQNANTKCNGLLPLWGPHVPESAFASCLARHNTYLQANRIYFSSVFLFEKNQFKFCYIYIPKSVFPANLVSSSVLWVSKKKCVISRSALVTVIFRTPALCTT
jgi:E3 ubiquitin-protein ligase UBR4